jgi:hypothetical protein
MNSRAFSVFAASLVLALPALALAGTRPDFDDDAKPILRAQPHLLDYIKAHYKVEEEGFARTPGTADSAPPPPYIFRAKKRGESGPDHITLLIQPGAPGHILLVKEDAPGATPPAQQEPTPAENPPVTSAPPPPQPAPIPSTIGSAPTSATPSGPIQDSSTSSPNGGNIPPPADPAPAN